MKENTKPSRWVKVINITLVIAAVIGIVFIALGDEPGKAKSFLILCTLVLLAFVLIAFNRFVHKATNSIRLEGLVVLDEDQKKRIREQGLKSLTTDSTYDDQFVDLVLPVKVSPNEIVPVRFNPFEEWKAISPHASRLANGAVKISFLFYNGEGYNPSIISV